MKPLHAFAFGAVFLALLGFAGRETSVLFQRRAQLAALHQQAAQLAGDTATARRERERDARDLGEAERQLANLPAPRADNASISPQHRTEIKAWLAHIRQLRRLFDERPDQRIPEMQFLTDQDWLRVAKDIELDSDEGRQKALAAVRDAASTRFLPQLSSALRKFAKTAPSDSTSIAALASFCEPPVDSSLLDRYELGKTSDSRSQPQWRVQTKAPLNPDYDSRHYVTAYVDGRGSGGGSLGAPWAWIPDFREQTTRAYKAFAEANKGTSAPGLAEVLPFFNPPLAPALAEKLLKAERERQK